MCGEALAQADAQMYEILNNRQQRIQMLRAQKAHLRTGAETDFQREIAECQQFILVNDCIQQAKNQRLEKIQQARRAETEASSLEREIKRIELQNYRNKKLRELANKAPAGLTHEVITQ